MNLILPKKGILPMHCSANTTGENTAIFFGLSGTGKTTLSADPKRALIGDDEHGWGANGVFNFEGGCYAKLIDLSEEDEPAIFATTRKHGTVLENIVLDSEGVPDFHDTSRTQTHAAPTPSNSSTTNGRFQGRSPAERHLPDLRCLWGAPTHLPPDALAGRLPLHLRLHRQGGRYRSRREGATSHLLRLFRRAVHAHAPGVYADLLSEDGSARLNGLAHQHRLVRWRYGEEAE